MITGYYDWNESIAYPMVRDVDTSVVGLSLSGLICGASISIPADVAVAVGTTFYVASMIRDRSNSVLITVAPTPTIPAEPVFAIDFRVISGSDRFITVAGVARGSFATPRAAAFLVLAHNAFVASMPQGNTLTFSAIPEFDPGVIRVSDRGSIGKVTVLKSLKRSEVALAYIDNPAGVATPITLDQISGAPVVSTAIVAAGVKYNVVASNGTTYVAMPNSMSISASVSTPSYSTAVRPVIEVGKTANASTRAVVGVPVDFKFTAWINDPAVYDVITAVRVFVDGVLTGIGGPDGLSKAELSAGFSYTFGTAGTHLVSIAAERMNLTGGVRTNVSFITFSAAVAVTASAAYTAPVTTAVVTGQPSIASVPVPNVVLAEESLLVQKTTVTRPQLTPLVVNAVLGADYDAEDEVARANVPVEALSMIGVFTAPKFVAGKNVVFSFSPSRNAVAMAIKAGAHIKVPYVGYAVPPAVACSGTARSLFGASPDEDGNITILAGAGVTVIPEPAAHRLTIIIEDPRGAASGKQC